MDLFQVFKNISYKWKLVVGLGGLITKLRPTLVTQWTVARQAPLSMGFSRQGEQSGLLFPSPSDLPNPGIEPASSALVGGFFTTEPPGKLDLYKNK